jgi:hypothetical protein
LDSDKDICSICLAGSLRFDPHLAGRLSGNGIENLNGQLKSFLWFE